MAALRRSPIAPPSRSRGRARPGRRACRYASHSRRSSPVRDRPRWHPPTPRSREGGRRRPAREREFWRSGNSPSSSGIRRSASSTSGRWSRMASRASAADETASTVAPRDSSRSVSRSRTSPSSSTMRRSRGRSDSTIASVDIAATAPACTAAVSSDSGNVTVNVLPWEGSGGKSMDGFEARRPSHAAGWDRVVPRAHPAGLQGDTELLRRGLRLTSRGPFGLVQASELPRSNRRAAR